MALLIIVVLIIGLAGIIGNQNSGLKRMEQLQRSLDDISQNIQAKNHNQE